MGPANQRLTNLEDFSIRRRPQLALNKIILNCTAIDIQIKNFINRSLPTLLKGPGLLAKPPNLKPERSGL